MYEGFTVYGPYKRKDNRLVVILRRFGCLKTLSYPKYLMEVHLGRYLERNEVVHHKDENPLNNNIDNLEIEASSSDHIFKHHCPQPKYPEGLPTTCNYCKRVFMMSRKRQSDAISKNKEVSFCSKNCAGGYMRSLQIEAGMMKLVSTYQI